MTLTSTVNCNLVPTVLSFLSPGARERERETLENVGQVSPRIWEKRDQRFPGSLSLSLAPGDVKERTLGTRLGQLLKFRSQ